MRHETVVGHTKNRVEGRSRSGLVTIETELRETEKGLELSMSGNVWNRAGSDTETGGQMGAGLADYVHTWKMDRARFKRMCEVWAEWHLNGMNAGCAHQRRDKWSSCPGHYSPRTDSWVSTGPKRFGRESREGYTDSGIIGSWFYHPRKAPVSAELPGAGLRLTVADDGIMVTRRVDWTFSNCAKQEEAAQLHHPGQTVRCSLDMLSKPCPECGYKYGSAWLLEPIPAEVVAEVRGWMGQGVGALVSGS